MVSRRLQRIYTKLEQAGLDSLIVSFPANISYLADYRIRDSYLIVSKKANIFITDFRYIEEAKRNIKIALIRKMNGSVFKLIADACLDLSFRRIGFEERHLPFAEYKKLNEEFNKKADLIPTFGLVEELREIKSPQELGKIKEAVAINIKAFKFIHGLIGCGIREIEIAAELERFIRYNGASSSAFDIIVASGPNSSFPHHITSSRKVKNNEPVLIDCGVDYLGYKSDLTRVFFSGRITSTIRSVYDIVLKSQDRAIKEIKAAVNIDKIDRVARQYIAQREYGGFFGHNLGHGIGLEVHEAPHISAKEKSKLKAGMVFTVEPAVYLPGRFGIRIEDMVLVREEGVELLSGNLDK
ncbi:MAG: aminopeptidase P family protein [Candidatus Omnitrophica bacterium]|nr:aminopeptidase P family protein [Candidatus Omnitrophota bacterium]